MPDPRPTGSGLIAGPPGRQPRCARRPRL